MLQQKRLIQLPLVGTLLLCLLAGLYLFAWKRLSKPEPPATIIQHPVETPAGEALKYWTADKMRAAKPTPLPNVKALNRVKWRPRRPPV
ncbi:MAG TPA: hypothetical protein VNE38_18240 [Ktedonobacteraceae bacterium]|nr:hypothetical protein [Ktedonobacteraceae bacterium]